MPSDVTKVQPSSPVVSWTNVGAQAEDNAYAYASDHKDPDDPSRFEHPEQTWVDLSVEIPLARSNGQAKFVGM